MVVRLLEHFEIKDQENYTQNCDDNKPHDTFGRAHSSSDSSEDSNWLGVIIIYFIEL